MWHLPSRELVADDRILVQSGIDPAAYSGRAEDSYAHIHPKDLAAVVAGVENAAATSEAYRVQYPDGDQCWVAAHGQAVTDDAGRVTALVGAAYDITALREATTRISDVLESRAVGYLAMDEHWRITHVNAEGERISGSPREDLVGHEFRQAFPATIGTVFEENYRRSAATGEVTTFDA